MKRNREQKRIKQIAAVFLKHGFSDPVEVRMAFEELGSTFVKIGQILSTRPDMIPESYILELQKLQDDVRAEPYQVIRDVIEQDLNATMDELFSDFAIEPIASASLAQVHLATLLTGEEVIVKVQRPGVREQMTKDIEMLKKVARIIKFAPNIKVVDVEGLADELMEASQKELNFVEEAENIKRFGENNKDVKFITSPRVYEEYTTSNIIVMDFIDGTKIGLVEELDRQGYDLEDMAMKLTNNYLKQIFQDGFFHGDPHPGNIIISGTKIGYIDFGIMGTLDRPLMKDFNEFLYGVATRDIDLMTTTILKIGVKSGPVNRKRLYSDIEELYNTYIEMALYDINIPKFMDEMIKVCRRNNISIPRDLTLLAKGLMTIEGVITKLAPDINIMEIAIPYIKSNMAEQHDIVEELEERIRDIHNLGKLGPKIPVKFLELINSVLAGRLKVQLEHTSLENGLNVINQMVNRLVFGIIVGSLIIGSSIVLNADVGPRIYDIPIIGFLGYAGAAVMGLWLLISILKSGKM